MKIEMELLSDAIPGSGEGIAGIIDGDITYNEFGIPHIPAKRIKGILRESARDLQDAGLLNADQIDRIFGVSGQEKGTELKLADGHVPDYENLRDFLKTITRGATYKKLASLFNQEAVLDYYCYTRSQTTINKNGVAQKDSLRTFRILKKKLKFYFNVVCPDGCEEDLENILKVTRAFGTSRTRGTGEIKLQIRDKESPDYSTEDVPAAEDRFIDSDLCTIKLGIHNVEQLLVTSQVGKTQDSEDYIPGSFILGAMAGRYISEYCSSTPHEDKDFQAIFLQGKVRFENAYPCQPGDNVYFPGPISFVKEKDKNHYIDLTDENKIENIINGKIQTKGTIGSFVKLGGTTVEYVSTETEMEYHHQRPPKDRSIGHATEDAGEFFQFNVIRADQRFQSSIIGEYRYLKKIMSILKKDNVLYLGKSRTAQYGKCVCTAEIDKKNVSQKIWEKGEKAVKEQQKLFLINIQETTILL